MNANSKIVQRRTGEGRLPMRLLDGTTAGCRKESVREWINTMEGTFHDTETVPSYAVQALQLSGW